MTGTVELDPDGTHLLIRFPYREDLVAMVKELPGRRWDPRQKVWRVPAAHVAEVYDQCSRHLFEFASEIPSLLAGTLEVPNVAARKGKDAAPRQGQLGLPLTPPTAAAVDREDDADSEHDDTPQALTISQLNERARDALRGAFPSACWVVGEIVDFDKSAGRQHRFFQLVEKAPRAQRPKAVVEVALFERTAQQLLPKLEASDPSLTLRDGLEVRALVQVDLYPASGRYQVIVQDIDPSFTLGKLALTKEQILRELAEKGLAERNRSLGLPVPALRIGVLTSPDADGWNDFLHHLQESRGGFQITIVPVKVQGPELKPTMRRGLAWFAEHQGDFDVLCILRGGGSRTDLAWFDDREVAFAVAQHPLKVLVGIGHQRDQSVLDLIAQSEKTPTAVAEFLVRGVEAAREDVDERAARLADAVHDLLRDHRETLDEVVRAIATAATRRVDAARVQLTQFGREIAARTAMRLAREQSDLRHAVTRLQHGAQRVGERQQARLRDAETRLRLLDPRRVLQRGFAIVRDEHGRIAPSTARVEKQQALRVQFRDGHADVRVDDVQRDES